LKKYKVKPNKKRGQSFLQSHAIAKDIVSHANLTDNDSVLEIGGGLGILTRWIAEQAGEVCVIELEHGLAEALKQLSEEFSNLHVMEGDALKVNLPVANKVVSNLPYSISSEVTFRLLKEMDFEIAVLMYQKEFAERLMASPGSPEYSRLSVNFQYLATAEWLMDVESKEFYPVPAVSSSVVLVRKRTHGPFAKDAAVFEWMIRGIYAYPNKNLRRALAIWFKNLKTDKKLTDVLFEKASTKVSPTDKLRTLDIDGLVGLADGLFQMIQEGQISGP
jgi:16S rRNA (adenine1518-N6/adenine1519-N6)-dimethyltransferase